MSKIQEALGRIQSANGMTAKARNEFKKESKSVVIAKIVDRGMDDESSNDSGRRLHVDRNSLRSAGLIAPEYHEKLLADQYRDIKRPLIAHAFGKRATKIEGGNLIMVCSALSGEGKTFTSINLALSMAQERDHFVLLVDADVAKPQLSEIFGASHEPGLLDVIEDPGTRIESMILNTDVKHLSILPAGKPRHNATELLASDSMDDIAATLSLLRPGQIVIFDMPPLLQTSEAKALSSLAGQIVLVVKAGETSQDAVKEALSSLNEETAVNLVLNQARSGFQNSQYGYGYRATGGYGQTEPTQTD